MAFFLIVILTGQYFWETEEQKDFEVLLLDLENVKNNPIDLNTADLNDLTKIPFLKVVDCLRIIGYRQKYGFFESVDDLDKVAGLDKALIEEIKPFVAVKTKPVKMKRFENRFRVQKDNKASNSEAYYTRTILDVNDYRVFLITEKDPYENSFVDYYSAGLVVNENKRKFAIGKYNLDFGSGVMLSSVGSFYQGVDFRLLTRERGIIPYTSTIENGGFFGAALSDSLLLNYCLFYSHQKLDGRVDTAGYARSFDPSGNHIDSASIARKDRIREEIFGYDLEYHNNHIQISQRAYWSEYEPPFVCEDSLVGFYGRNYWLAGIETKYYTEQFLIFAEVCRSFQNRFGSIFGWTGLLPYNFEFNLATKYFSPGFYAPKGAEAEKDYLGAYFDFGNSSPLISASTTLNIYTDNTADSNNYDWRLNLSRQWGFAEAKIQFRWLYRQAEKELSGSRVFLRMRPKKFMYLDLRLEEKYVYEDTLKNGIFGGIELGLETEVITTKIRYGIFDTDSYSTRVYVYEPDLLGIINNRVLYGKGKYGLVYLSYNPVKAIRFSFKYFASDRDSLNQHVGAQLDTKF
ncbi:MAG: helix-hairpin-helix domain-containing protein [bacterium]